MPSVNFILAENVPYALGFMVLSSSSEQENWPVVKCITIWRVEYSVVFFVFSLPVSKSFLMVTSSPSLTCAVPNGQREVSGVFRVHARR